MKISELLWPGRITLDLTATDKTGAINEVASLLHSTPEVSDFSRFLQGIFEREELSTTGIGNGVAIPHARTDAIKDFVIAFGRSKAGVEFGAIDCQPVHLIFLMGTPRDRNMNVYLKTLAQLSHLLNRKSFRERLMMATSPHEVLESFREEEAANSSPVSFA